MNSKNEPVVKDFGTLNFKLRNLPLTGEIGIVLIFKNGNVVGVRKAKEDHSNNVYQLSNREVEQK